MSDSMEMTHFERQDAIDALMNEYKARAKKMADEIWEKACYHSERDRQALMTGCLEGRIRMLLEDVAIWSPRLFAELSARVERRDAA